MKFEFTTGEFAKMCNISKKTLFHYDKIGLLKPAHVDDNGYRYYTIYQYDTISMIKLFQELGMSLKDIQSMFDLSDPALKSKLLHHQKKSINQRIHDLEKIRDGIDFLAERFDYFRSIGVDKLFEEVVEENEFYYVEDKSDEPVSVNYLNYGYQYGVLFKEENLSKKMKEPKHSYVFQRVAEKDSNFVKPAGRYLSIFHMLTNEEIMSCVPPFMERIEGYATQGPLYHEDSCSEIAGYHEHFIIKLSIQLQTSTTKN